MGENKEGIRNRFITDNAYKELECLFAWAKFYGNAKDLAVPTQFNQQAFEKIQLKINDLGNKLFKKEWKNNKL
jgi:hypothetical protein